MKNKSINKYLLPLIAIILLVKMVNAQQLDYSKIKDTLSISVPDIEAQYNGHIDWLYAFIELNLPTFMYKLPKDSLQNMGPFIFSFIVESDGTITECTLLEGHTEIMNSVLLEIIKNMPDWIPAKKNGENIRSRVILPVSLFPVLFHRRIVGFNDSKKPSYFKAVNRPSYKRLIYFEWENLIGNTPEFTLMNTFGLRLKKMDFSFSTGSFSASPGDQNLRGEGTFRLNRLSFGYYALFDTKWDYLRLVPSVHVGTLLKKEPYMSSPNNEYEYKKKTAVGIRLKYELRFFFGASLVFFVDYDRVGLGVNGENRFQPGINFRMDTSMFASLIRKRNFFNESYYRK